MINRQAPKVLEGDRLYGIPWRRIEQRDDTAEAMGISAGEEQQISRIRRQGRTEQGCHQSVGFGEIEVEPIAPVPLKLGHGGEGLLDREQRTADAPEAATQLGRLHAGELSKGLRLEQVIFPLHDVWGQPRPLMPESKCWIR